MGGVHPSSPVGFESKGGRVKKEPDRWGTLRRVFRLPLGRKSVPQDVDAELHFHLEGRIEELMARGMSRRGAEAEARRRFGDLSGIRATVEAIDHRIHRKRSIGEWGFSFRREARQALRSLWAHPGFAMVVVTTLALGIGASTTIYTLLNTVVLHPLPYPEANRLVHVEHPVPGVKADAVWGLSVAGYFYFRGNNRTFEDLGAYQVSPWSVAVGSTARRVRGGVLDASVLQILRAKAAVGRLFISGDNRPGAPSIALLGHDYWVDQFGADPKVIGRIIRIESSPVQVVGILADGFGLPDQPVDVLVPLTLNPNAPAVNAHWLNTVGRLKPGTSLAEARSDLARLTSRLPQMFPRAYSDAFMRESRFSVSVVSLREHVVGDVAQRLWILSAAVLLVLLIACANVANIFLVRQEHQHREIALRTALGAERAHLLEHYLSESLLLCGMAAAGGVGLAYTALQLLVAVLPAAIPRISELHLGWSSVAFAALLALTTGTILGAIPALGRTVDMGALREGARRLTASRRGRAVRTVLLVGQVAFALVLVSGAGLMFESFRNLRKVQPGFDPHGVLTFEVALPAEPYSESFAKVSLFYQEFLSRIRALAGVKNVGATEWLPLSAGTGCSSVFVEGHPLQRGEEPPCVGTYQIAPGYLETMGIPVEGSAFSWTESDQRAGGVVVTRALARRLWPNQSAIGQGIKGNGDSPPYYRVIGVAGDVPTTGLDQPPLEAVFFPMQPMVGAPLWMPPRDMTVVVRTAGVVPTLLIGSIRRLLTELAPEVPLGSTRTLEQVVADSMIRTSLLMSILAVAGVLALTLSIVGTYGLISFIVAQRTSEIGVRMALGAEARQIGRAVVGRSVLLTAVGGLIGVGASLATSRALRSFLFGVSPTDLRILASVLTLFVVAGAIASFLPARRATRIDPTEALRAE